MKEGVAQKRGSFCIRILGLRQSWPLHGGAPTNGATTTYGYDTLSGLLSRLEHSGISQPVTFTYGYNRAGQIVSKASSNDAYTFTAHSLGSTGASVNGQNQLTSLGGTTLSHDARGNMTKDPVLNYTFGYSSENLLTTVANGTA